MHCHQGCGNDDDDGCGYNDHLLDDVLHYIIIYDNEDNHDDTVPCDDRFNCPKLQSREGGGGLQNVTTQVHLFTISIYLFIISKYMWQNFAKWVHLFTNLFIISKIAIAKCCHAGLFISKYIYHFQITFAKMLLHRLIHFQIYLSFLNMQLLQKNGEKSPQLEASTYLHCRVNRLGGKTVHFILNVTFHLLFHTTYNNN